MGPGNDAATDWVARNARRFPDAPALEDGDTGESRSWSQLEDRVGRVAGLLRGRFGVGAGDRVGILAEGDPRFFEVMFACMRIGAVMVPFNWRLAVPEIVALAQDAELAVLLHDGVWADAAGKVAADAGVEQLAAWRSAADSLDFDELVAASPPLRAGTERLLSSPTHILHTSGTTGTPKGAITTTGTMTWHTMNVAQEALLNGPGSRMLNPLPLFHAGGLTTVATPMLMTGGCVTTLRRFDPDQVMRMLADPSVGVTHWTAVPIMYQALANTAAFATADLSGLRYAQVAGGVPALELLQLWDTKGVVMQQAYGGTELGPAVATMPRDAVAAHPTSCGRAVPHTHVRLVTDDGREAATGEVGEVHIAGPSVTPGYWRRPAGTGFSDGWFLTGDAARRDEEGFFYLVDRVKDMYKSGGENVYPAEVERMIAEHPDVVEVGIVGVPDPRWGEVGAAYVVTRGGATLTLADIEAHCAGRLARYKLPKSLVLRSDELPRNSTGKVQKQLLRPHGQA